MSGAQKRKKIFITDYVAHQCEGYVRQITVPHHHTTGGRVHESVRHKNTSNKTTHVQTQTHCLYQPH